MGLALYYFSQEAGPLDVREQEEVEGLRLHSLGLYV